MRLAGNRSQIASDIKRRATKYTGNPQYQKQASCREENVGLWTSCNEVVKKLRIVAQDLQ
jgi:hypothetical protein